MNNSEYDADNFVWPSEDNPRFADVPEMGPAGPSTPDASQEHSADPAVDAWPAKGLRKFDLGMVPASVTPPRTWRHAAWFAVIASAAALAGLVFVAAALFGSTHRVERLDAYPGYPNGPLFPPTSTEPDAPGAPMSPPANTRTQHGPTPPANGGGSASGATSLTPPSHSAARGPAAGSTDAGGGADAQGSPGSGAASSSSSAQGTSPSGGAQPTASGSSTMEIRLPPQPPMVVPYGAEAQQFGAPSSAQMTERGQDFYNRVASGDLTRAYELTTGPLRAQGYEAFSRRFADVANLRIIHIAAGPEANTASVDLQVTKHSGEVVQQQRQLGFSNDGRALINAERLTGQG